MKGLPGLRQYRQKKNLSQQALAKALGVSPITICRYECGAADPRLSMVGKIADYLGIPERELLFPEPEAHSAD